jgi:hypothetical protein
VNDDIVEVHRDSVFLEICERTTYISAEFGWPVDDTLRHTGPVVETIRCTERRLVDTVWMHLDLVKSGSHVTRREINRVLTPSEDIISAGNWGRKWQGDTIQ